MLFRQCTNHLILVTLILQVFGLLGCASGTLVFNGSCLIPIEQLCAGVEVTSFTRQWQFVSRTLRFCGRALRHEQLTKLIFHNGESATVARCQKFLLFDTHEWTCAHKLGAGSRLVMISNEPCVVQQVIDSAGAGPVWHIDVGCPHTFFISHLCVLTHNTDCTIIMSTALQEGILASALAGTSFGATITALLASWGAKIGFSGGALTCTVPFSLPLCCAAVGGAALGAAGYYAYKLTKQAIELEFAKNVIASAEYVAGEITKHKSNKHSKKDKSYRRSNGNKPPKGPEGPVGVENVAKVTTAHRVYEFIKKKWRECKSACHDVYSIQSKKGQQCGDCKGPAFRANYLDNPKHGTVKRANISPRPIDGEQAMYNSVSWNGDVGRRFGTSNSQIVEIKSSGNNPQNLYHGYVLELEDLSTSEIKFLKENGLIDARGRPF